MLTVEQHAKNQKTPSWLFAAARVKFGWAIGRELSLEQYVDAIEATRRHSAGN